MNNQVLSIEQMKELIELGIDISKASVCWYGTVEVEFVCFGTDMDKDCGDEICPTFTLQDILDMLPKHLNIKDKTYFLTLMCDITGVVVTYCTEYIKDILHSEGSSNQINAAVNMLKWCKENNYI